MGFHKLLVSLSDEQITKILQFSQQFDLEQWGYIVKTRCLNPYIQPDLKKKQNVINRQCKEVELFYFFTDSQKIQLKCQNITQFQNDQANQTEDYFRFEDVIFNIFYADARKQLELSSQLVSIKYVLIERALYPEVCNKYTVSDIFLKFSSEIKEIGKYFQDLQLSLKQVFGKQEDRSTDGVGGLRNLEAGRFQSLEKSLYEEDQPINKLQQISQIRQTISIINANLQIEDSKMSRFFLGYQAFVREFASHQKHYHERNYILSLQHYQQLSDHPLINIHFGLFQISIGPLAPIQRAEDALRFITQIEQPSFQLEDKYFVSYRALAWSVLAENVSLQLRDYPYNVVLFQQMRVQNDSVTTQLYSVEQKTYRLRVFFQCEIVFDQITFNVGLCQASGLNEVLRRLSEIFANPPLPPQPLMRPKKKSLIEETSQKIFNASQLTQNLTSTVFSQWDFYRFCFHGKFLVQQRRRSEIRVLTGIYPYQTEALIVTLRPPAAA